MSAKPEEIPVSKFKTSLFEILDKLTRTGRPIIVTRRGRPIAQILPAPGGSKRPLHIDHPEDAGLTPAVDAPSARRGGEWLGALRGTGRIIGDIVGSAADDIS